MQGRNLQFYQSHSELCDKQISELKQKAFGLSLGRLVVFLTMVLVVYFFFGDLKIIIPTILVGSTLFLLLVNFYVNMKASLHFWKAKQEIINKELQFLDGEIELFEDGSEYIDHKHFFSSDIDLFGPNSLFQYVNRTKIVEATVLLANIFRSNHTENIEKKQAVVQELSENPEWNLNYSTKASLVDQTISHKVVFNWLNSYQSIVPKRLIWIAYLLIATNIVLLTLYLFGRISIYPTVGSFFLGLFLTSLYVKKINHISIHLAQLKAVFSNYGGLLEEIENREFKSDYCREKQLSIKNSTEKASSSLKQFSKYLNALDQRNNILFGILGNGFLLWDCQQVSKIEKWINSQKQNVEKWFEAITWFDAQISLANFNFNNANFVFPNLNNNSGSIIEATELGHFFISSEKRIENDFKLEDQNFLIITGANMAGKSTFLRTVALSILCANTGLPVCAKEFNYSPIKLITSMRNTDSLKDDSSYFFAELARLKIIVDAVEEEPYFVILVEILKGTNSKDKEEGSIKLMRKLSKTKACGLIATHDLGLCEIEKEIPTIANKYFDAEIINDELYFDYKLKPGICQNMNASFLLKKMDIV